jgi:hypothetical protein
MSVCVCVFVLSSPPLCCPAVTYQSAVLLFHTRPLPVTKAICRPLPRLSFLLPSVPTGLPGPDLKTSYGFIIKFVPAGNTANCHHYTIFVCIHTRIKYLLMMVYRLLYRKINTVSYVLCQNNCYWLQENLTIYLCYSYF